MANQYSWQTANSKGYKAGKYGDVDGKIAPITRYTVVDGDLLATSFVDVLSSRDTYCLDSLNLVDASARSLHTTVENNSGSNWPISAISGFNKVKVGTNSPKSCKPYAGSELDFTIQDLGVKTSNGNKIEISALDQFNNSYWNLCTMLDSNFLNSKGKYSKFGTVSACNDLSANGRNTLMFNSTLRWGNGIHMLNTNFHNDTEGFVTHESSAMYNGIAMYHAQAMKGISIGYGTYTKERCHKSQY